MIDAVVIICSRLKSSRLPRKVLKPLAGIPTLMHIFNRLKVLDIPIILACPQDDAPEFCKLDAPYVDLYTGQPESPLHRMAEAVKKQVLRPKYIVRVTHDDPLIDAETVRELLNQAEIQNAGYAISPDIVEGAGVEVIATENLLRAAEARKEPTEFISYFVKGGLPNPKEIIVRPRPSICRPYRLTMDYPEDAVVLENVLRACGPDASLDDICLYLDQNPHILTHNKQPLVTVYTCAYNAVKTISQTMNSVIHSGFRDMEYIVVEDGSTDGTLNEILRTMAIKQEVNVRLIINEKNLGLASSSNVAITNARGKYILRMDADDILSHGAISHLVDIIKYKNAAIVYPNYTEMNYRTGTIKDNMAGNLYHHAGGALMDKRLLNELRFKEGLRHWDSIELYKRMKDKFIVEYAEFVTFIYRVHDKNMSLPTTEREETLKTIRFHHQDKVSTTGSWAIGI